MSIFGSIQFTDASLHLGSLCSTWTGTVAHVSSSLITPRNLASHLRFVPVQSIHDLILNVGNPPSYFNHGFEAQ